MLADPKAGHRVRVLPPFADSFPGEFTITEVITHEDGQTACVLGEAGAFAPEYLEPVE
jgi:hypothetical protein